MTDLTPLDIVRHGLECPHCKVIPLGSRDWIDVEAELFRLDLEYHYDAVMDGVPVMVGFIAPHASVESLLLCPGMCVEYD